ncbi:MAG: FtsX-like permease family protein [Actinomycetota bacterium]
MTLTAAPAYRATARIARRQARRSAWRSVLIMVLVALPIAALSGAAITIRTAMSTPEEEALQAMGTADVMLTVWSDKLRPRTLERKLPAGTAIIEVRSVYTQNIAGGSLIYLPVHEFPVRVDDAPVRGMFKILAGRAPHGPGEAAVHPEALEAFGAAIGDEIVLEDIGLRLRITGTVAQPLHLEERTAVVGAGTLANVPDATPDGYLIDLPPGADLDEAQHVLSNAEGVEGYATRDLVASERNRDSLVATSASFAGAAVALFCTGLIAAAAFVVGARRQLRTLGLIGAAGGEPRHVRATVLFAGVTLGFAGSVIGVLLGVAGSLAVHPYLDGWVEKLVGPVEVPWIPLSGAVALGTAAATAAAFGPARSAARLSTVQALEGRTPPPRAPGRLAAVGLAAVGGGAALTAWATVADARSILTVGLIAIVGGFLVAIPLLVTWVGRLARFLPTAPRLAARALVRHARRTGAALAAATLALTLPVAVSAVTLSDEAFERRITFMGPDHLVLSAFVPGDDREKRTEALLDDFRSLFPQAIVVPLRVAVFSPERYPLPDDLEQEEWTAWVEGAERTVREGVAYVANGELLIGGPDLLRVFHAEEGIPALQAGKVVAIGPDSADHGVVHLQLPPDEKGNEPKIDLPAEEAGGTRYASLGQGEDNFVISPDAAALLGLRPSRDPGRVRFGLRASGALTGEDIRRAKDVAAKHPGAFVTSAEDLGSDAGTIRLMLALAAGVVALAIVGVAIALVGAESRRDGAILVAVGAEPGMRRKVAASSASLLAGVAGLVAVPAGVLPVAVIQASQREGHPIVMPWLAIAIVVVGVSVLAGVVAAILSRQPKAAQLLRPLA